MKWDQVDQAIQFSGYKGVVIQFTHPEDKPAIIRYLKETYRCPFVGTNQVDVIDDLNQVTLHLMPTNDPLYGFSNDQLFLVERETENYIDGDIIGETMGGVPLIDTRPVPSSASIYYGASKSTAMVRRHDTPLQLEVIRSQVWDSPDPDMMRTMVIQFPTEDMRNLVMGYVRKFKHKNADSWIDEWRSIDIFVDISAPRPTRTSKPHWLRIVYECLDGNPNPGERFQGAYHIVVDRTFDPQGPTLDTLIRGVN